MYIEITYTTRILLLMILSLIIYASIREVFILSYYMFFWKWINASIFHSVNHLILSILIPIISYHTIVYSQCLLAIIFLLFFMCFTLFHLVDERNDFFWPCKKLK